jgi:CRISPR/Cas system CSM-associated protein Csm4 (group 5 of RAMP superfamily)
MGGQTTAATVLEGVIASSTRIQTAIDREMGSAADGQLFEIDTQRLRKRAAQNLGPGGVEDADASFDYLSVYIRSDHRIEQVSACLRALAWTGFGKKSSTGLGQFKADAAPEKCDWLDEVPGANAWTALSHFVPAPGDPADGRWRTHVTFPKFHANAVSNVFKGSILMLTPGSVFRTDEEPPRPWYGSMIPMPRPEMPRALHYGLCFPAPLLWSRQAL